MNDSSQPDALPPVQAANRQPNPPVQPLPEKAGLWLLFKCGHEAKITGGSQADIDYLLANARKKPCNNCLRIRR